jgi:tryptophan-rich sensory protein
VRAAGPRAWLALALFVIAAEAVGALGAIATLPQIPTWYAGLAKPSFTPPDRVFGPVWNALYALMGVAAWLVWREPAGPARRRALAAWAIQLALNLAWSWIFFAFHALLAAAVEILVLLAAIAWTTARFASVSRPAAWLLAPYLAWVGFAAVLTWEIWRLNPPA